MKIIIDTDPGQDDAAAIMLALGSPEIDLLGITAVAGNVPLELTARNARIVCEMSGRTDIRVFAGADKPLPSSPFSSMFRICFLSSLFSLFFRIFSEKKI